MLTVNVKHLRLHMYLVHSLNLVSECKTLMLKTSRFISAYLLILVIKSFLENFIISYYHIYALTSRSIKSIDARIKFDYKNT